MAGVCHVDPCNPWNPCHKGVDIVLIKEYPVLQTGDDEHWHVQILVRQVPIGIAAADQQCVVTRCPVDGRIRSLTEEPSPVLGQPRFVEQQRTEQVAEQLGFRRLRHNERWQR